MSEDVVVPERRPFADGTVCSEASLARQSEADMADINKILKRAEKAGILPIREEPGEFIDVSEVGDYREAVERVRLMDEQFRQLPAEVRGHFSNDPAEFLDAVNDPARRGELEELGLLKPKPEVVAAGEKALAKAKRQLAREIDAELDAEARAQAARSGQGPGKA